MSRPDLPGFYFDHEKNRYFPLSHQKKRAKASEQAGNLTPLKSKRPGERKCGLAGIAKLGSTTTEDGVLGLMHRREISGNRRYGQSSSSAKAFQGDYLETQTARPRVWNYSNTSDCADGGIVQLRLSLQSAEGEAEVDVMTLGGSNGRVGIWQIVEPVEFDHFYSANHCLPTNPDLWTGEERDAPVVWPIMQTMVLPSKITSIKRLNEWPDPDRLQNGNRLQQSVVITTLGDGMRGGAVHLLSFTEGYRFSRKMTTSQSVWTAESNPRGKSASIGMGSGAGIVDLERGQMKSLCRSSSDVLSQQFDSSGNIVLCGFRNGVISTIDLRLPQPKPHSSHSSDSNWSRSLSNIKWSKFHGAHHKSKDSRLSRKAKKSYRGPHQAGQEQKSLRIVDKLFCSHSPVMQMKSAICSLALLRSSEWYLLGSSMNGDIQQWDRRVVERGAVRSYEGHVNSHTTLQLGVDPTERLLISGGEDCAVRVWSVDSGRLLHEEFGLTSPVTTVSWPTSFRTSDASRWDGYWEEPPFESDHPWALWMGSSSGLLHMHGAAR